MRTPSRHLRLVIFDMAGTTVHDEIDGVPLVLKSYDDAFKMFGIAVPMNMLNEQRGKDKRTVIELFGGEQASRIYERFTAIALGNVKKLREMEGSTEAFGFLHRYGVKVALNSGFPKEVTKGIIEHIGWDHSGVVDFWTCSEEVGKSRPDPAMILASMSHLKVDDPTSVMKIDDTVVGIEEGLRAGATTIGVLTGTQSKEKLITAGPADIILSVKQLPDYLLQKGYV